MSATGSFGMDYQGLFEASPNPYLVLDRKLRIVGANRAYLASIKRGLADIIGCWAWNAFSADPETVRQSVASFERVIHMKKPDTVALLRFDIPRPEAEGGGFMERYWSVTHSPVLDETGEVSLVLQHPIDVTELQHLQDAIERTGLASVLNIKPAQSGIFGRAQGVYESNLALQEERDRLNAMFAHAPSFMAMLRGREHRIELANPAYMHLVGDRPILGRTVAEALPDAVAQGYLDLLNRVFDSGEAYTAKGASYVVTVTPGAPTSKRFVDFVYQPIKDSKGQVLGIFVEGTDVTERISGELALREGAERLSALVSASSEVLYSMSADWSEMRQLTGSGFLADTRTANPSWLADYIPPDEQTRVMAAIQEAIRTKRIFHLEHKVRLVDGSLGWTLSRAVPLLDTAGEITEWFGAASDVTARREAEEALRRLNETLEEQIDERTRNLMAVEEALRQSQKMEAVGQLTGGLAHDFNNLLTGVTGSLEMLQTRIAQGRINDVDRYVNAAQGAARRAAALTQRLLAFSRRQTLSPRPTEMNQLVRGMEELVQRTVGPEIAVEVAEAGGLWTTLVDPGQLENTLLNLCINARDAMPQGGRITIETANRWLDGRTAREQELPPGPYVTLCVRDIGTGMAPDVIARAFEPFFTTKPIGMGTGLGLSMIYGFVRQSGGQVCISSDVGKGTTVCVYLPKHLGGEDITEGVPELAEAPHAEQGEAVLVVDDEPTVRMLVTEVLEELGYTAIEAADGPAGLKVLQSDTRIDLLVTDVGLPGGLNGRQVADAARLLRPGLKVMFITGYAEHSVLSHGHLEPGMHVLTKPFAMEVLASRIRELLVGG